MMYLTHIHYLKSAANGQCAEDGDRHEDMCVDPARRDIEGQVDSLRNASHDVDAGDERIAQVLGYSHRQHSRTT